MTLPTGIKTKPRNNGAAFTLIELILVMALLVVVVAVTFPTLQSFFRGRSLDAEGRRLLTLTRYGQSRAVSEGVPMTLWVDARAGTYGLETAAGYLDNDPKAVDYELAEALEFGEISETNPSGASMTDEQQYRRANVRAARTLGPEIRFLPDGSIDLSSLETITIRLAGQKDSALQISRSENRLNYEVKTDAPNKRQ